MGVFPTQIGTPGGVNQNVFSDAVTKAIISNPLQVEATQNQAENTAIQNEYQAAASQLTQQGDLAEADLYGNASSIAGQNSLLALSASDIQQAQTQLKISKTIGSQQASIASAGFANSGSALDLFRSSKQQGMLDLQLDQVNGQLSSNGYLAQEAAANAEQSAARTAAGVAGVTGQMASTLAAKNQTIATNEAALIAQASMPATNPSSPNTVPHTLSNPFPGGGVSYDPTTGQPITPTLTTQYNTQTGQPQQVTNGGTEQGPNGPIQIGGNQVQPLPSVSNILANNKVAPAV